MSSARDRFRASYPRAIPTAVPDGVNSEQFCPVYEQIEDPEEPTRLWRGARTVTLERCVAQRVPELADAVDITEVHRAVGNVTPHLLELHRRRGTA